MKTRIWLELFRWTTGHFRLEKTHAFNGLPCQWWSNVNALCIIYDTCIVWFICEILILITINVLYNKGIYSEQVTNSERQLKNHTPDLSYGQINSFIYFDHCWQYTLQIPLSTLEPILMKIDALISRTCRATNVSDTIKATMTMPLLDDCSITPCST